MDTFSFVILLAFLGMIAIFYHGFLNEIVYVKIDGDIVILINRIKMERREPLSALKGCGYFRNGYIFFFRKKHHVKHYLMKKNDSSLRFFAHLQSNYPDKIMK